MTPHSTSTKRLRTSATRAVLFALMLAAIGATVGVLAAPARADVGVTLANGLRFSGNAPAGDDIRIRFTLAKGAQPRLTVNLSGSRLAPVSFTGGPGGEPAIELHTPDDEGELSYEDEERLLSDALNLAPQRIRRGRSTFRMRGFSPDVYPEGAPRTGVYELVLRTNAIVNTVCSGRFVSRRVTRQRFEGDENDNEVNVNVIVGDEVRVVMRRVSGDKPQIVGLTFPNGSASSQPPSQVFNRRGARTRFAFRVVSQFGQGVLGYQIGYQDGGTAGEFKGVARLKPGRTSGTVPVLARNPPGVPLSVREFDGASTKLGFADLDSEIGIALDARDLIATGERTITPGERVLIARRFLVPNLTVPPNENFQPFVVATKADFPQGEVIRGHRLLASGRNLFAAVGTESGNYIRIFRFRLDTNPSEPTAVLNVGATREVIPNAGFGESGHDFFIVAEAGDPGVIAIGLATGDPTRSHRVYRYRMDTFESAGPPLEIGRSADALGHVSPVAMQQRTLVGFGESPFFELWGGDRQDLSPQANLHRQEYAATTYAAAGPDRAYLFDYDDDGTPDSEIEHSPTGLSIDQDLTGGVVPSGASIVHYIVPDVGRADGTGSIHRRVFREDASEVIGSHVVIPGPGLGQPVSTIINVTAQQSFVFVAFISDTGPEIRRYALIR